MVIPSLKYIYICGYYVSIRHITGRHHWIKASPKIYNLSNWSEPSSYNITFKKENRRFRCSHFHLNVCFLYQRSVICSIRCLLLRTTTRGGRCKPLPSSLLTFIPQSKQCLRTTSSQKHNYTNITVLFPVIEVHNRLYSHIADLITSRNEAVHVWANSHSSSWCSSMWR